MKVEYWTFFMLSDQMPAIDFHCCDRALQLDPYSQPVPVAEMSHDWYATLAELVLLPSIAVEVFVPFRRTVAELVMLLSVGLIVSVLFEESVVELMMLLSFGPGVSVLLDNTVAEPLQSGESRVTRSLIDCGMPTIVAYAALFARYLNPHLSVRIPDFLRCQPTYLPQMGLQSS